MLIKIPDEYVTVNIYNLLRSRDMLIKIPEEYVTVLDFLDRQGIPYDVVMEHGKLKNLSEIDYEYLIDQIIKHMVEED